MMRVVRSRPNNGGLPKAYSCHSQPFELCASTNALQTTEERERLFLRESSNVDRFSCISDWNTYLASYFMVLTRSDEFGARWRGSNLETLNNEMGVD